MFLEALKFYFSLRENHIGGFRVMSFKNLISLSGLFVMLSIHSSIACDIHGKTGIFPLNNMKIHVGESLVGGITEAQFNTVLDKIDEIISPFVTRGGGKLTIERRWTDPTVNAFAEEETPGIFGIHMFGGLARHAMMTEDAMALVACHEIGHHLGGAPVKSDDKGNPRWAANEGQADYWASMKCLKQYFEKDDNVNIVKNLKVSTIVKTACKKQFVNANDEALCERTAVADFVLASVLASLGGPNEKVDFKSKDKSVVTKTFDGHPASQCRLDTLFQGALCDHNIDEVDSKTDTNVGVCSVRNGDKVGNRPLCWFKGD